MPPSSDRQKTIADVAKTAGITPMTVSRFFNHPELVASKTKQKIRAAVDALGYRPNIAARMLTGQSSNAIGLIVPTLTDSYFAAVANSVQEVAREKGYLLWVASSDEQQDIQEAQMDQMQRHHVDGILLVPSVGPHPWAPSNSLPPLVTVDRPVPGKHDAVLVENRQGGFTATEHLIQHGYRRIAYVCIGAPDEYTARERLAGYEDAMRLHKLTPSITMGALNRSQLHLELKKMFASKAAPRALFTGNNVTTIYVIEFLLDAGIAVPQDVALFGFDDFELASYMRPSISVIRQSPMDVGRQAALRLFDQLEKSAISGIKVYLPVETVIRRSCGC